MKLTSEKLKHLIVEVLEEQGKKERIMNILRGQDDAVDTVAIMSGQNPMASQTAPSVNDRLQRDLEKELKSRGYKFERIGGIFGGHSEKSLVILNARKADMDELNRKFGQWGFVFGEKEFTPDSPMAQDEEGMIAGNEAMVYQMFEIDYDEERGYSPDEYSSPTSQVMGSSQLQGVDDNFSYIPGGGAGSIPKGNKILIPLYGVPQSNMTDETIDQILRDLDSFSR